MPSDESETMLTPALFDADLDLSQEDRVQLIRDVITMLDDEYEEGVPFERIAAVVETAGIEEEQVRCTLESLRKKGVAIEFADDHYILT